MVLSTTEEQKRKFEGLRQKEAEEAAERLAAKLNLSYANLITSPINTDALGIIPEEKARLAEAAVIQKIRNRLQFCATNPENPETKKLIDELKAQKYELNILVVSKKSLSKALDFYKEVAKPVAKVTGKIQVAKTINDFSEAKKIIEEIPSGETTKTLEAIMAGALGLGASDVHIEAEETQGKVRYRIDGILQDIAILPLKIYKSVINRLKLISEMQINVKDVPQDGRFSILWENLEVEIRASLLPSSYGESFVIRVLNPKSINVTIEQLGFRKDDYGIIQEELKKPNGMILNTGPTGSGKTTTLYSFLRKLNEPGVKIITIEDPIEYHIKGLSQSQIETEKGYTFANGLRSILRQDPDVILVGEIRDKDTAEIAIHAALTGHLVFSTLHTNDSAGTIPRLVDMGINQALISSSVNMIIAQRLIRKICANCSKKEKIPKELLEIFKKNLINLPERAKMPEFNEETEINLPQGCAKCNFTGYKGRIGIFELLKITPALEKLISTLPNESEIKELSIKEGMVTMQQDGIIKIIEGSTTLEEVESTVGTIK